MKVLFVSSSPIRKEISIGNTFLNLFAGMEDVELASVFTRTGNPNKEISSAFCVTEKMLISNLLKKTPVGVSVEPCEKKDTASFCETKNEQGIIKFMKSRRWTVFFWLQNFIWKIGRWKCPELKKFIDEYNPDVIFTVLSDSVFLNNLILYLKKISGAPLALYAWDNNYSLKRFMLSPLKWINHFINRAAMKKTAKAADMMYVISDVQKNDYEIAFSRECKVLTKGEAFENEDFSESIINNPIQLVYTGNIGMNRWKSLAHVANVLEKINSEEIRAQLKIYTGNEITPKIRASLQKGNSSFLMGSVSSNEVINIQKEADILVHVEAMDLNNRLLVRQSFSTKLVDYFHGRKCILAFGPKDVASISHLEKNDAAIIADNERELEEKIIAFLNDTKILHEYAEKAWQCGKKNHQKNKIQSMLKDDLKQIISNK